MDMTKSIGGLTGDLTPGSGKGGTGALFRSPRSGLKAITLADALLSGIFTARQHGAHG